MITCLDETFQLHRSGSNLGLFQVYWHSPYPGKEVFRFSNILISTSLTLRAWTGKHLTTEKAIPAENILSVKLPWLITLWSLRRWCTEAGGGRTSYHLKTVRYIEIIFMESAHERFLLTSYDASKQPTSERSERISLCMHLNEWIKIIQALSMVWCFISYIVRFFLIDRHISKLGSHFFCPPRRSTIVRVSDWTNDVFPQSFAQYVRNPRYFEVSVFFE